MSALVLGIVKASALGWCSDESGVRTEYYGSSKQTIMDASWTPLRKAHRTQRDRIESAHKMKVGTHKIAVKTYRSTWSA